ncbi:MAG TPA: cation transporter [Terriglobales bacterium]|nr:cation transporter [Terriglobales bacterium]
MGSEVVVREHIVQRGLKLEYLTLAWNSLEAVVAIVAGVISGSIALVGFGLDSVIEMSSGAVLLWRLRSDADVSRRERVEGVALRLVGGCFIALALYVAWDAAKALWLREKPDESIAGMIIAALSLIVMPLLARAKRKVASGLNSGAMQADSRQTDICAYLSAILLGGLGLNAALGWWWADPVAGIVMVPIIAKEGIEALRGQTCACHTSPAASDPCCCEHESGTAD